MEAKRPSERDLLKKAVLFEDLSEALRYQRWVENDSFKTKTTVLFAVQHKNADLKKGVAVLRLTGVMQGREEKYSGDILDSEGVASKVFTTDAAYNFATAFQDTDGKIRFWEWMPSGETK